MINENNLDEFDKKILIQLEKDGRKPYSEIAKNLNISNTMVHQRVTRMKKIGILKGAGIILDERKLGYE